MIGYELPDGGRVGLLLLLVALCGIGRSGA